MTSYRYGYARVSTAEQDPALQIDALTAAGVDPTRVFVDVASGALAVRPQLEKLRHQLRPGDTLVVWRLDRLGRSLPHLVGLVTELGDQQIGFVSLTEAIDTTTPAGRLLFGVMASLAQFERDLIRERTTAGLAAAKARGRCRPGGQRSRWVGGRPAIMTPDKLAVARQMLAEGKPKALVAKTIGVSRPTLYAHLTDNR
ncbi:MAG: recombinase family protein [Nakamurella sp.]